jgi:hypothetical protein
VLNLIALKPEYPLGFIVLPVFTSFQVTLYDVSKFGPTSTVILPRPSYPSGIETSPLVVTVVL